MMPVRHQLAARVLRWKRREWEKRDGRLPTAYARLSNCLLVKVALRRSVHGERGRRQTAAGGIRAPSDVPLSIHQPFEFSSDSSGRSRQMLEDRILTVFSPPNADFGSKG